MATKEKARRKVGEASGPKGIDGLFGVRLQLEREDHHRLRIAAAKAGVPMSVFAREAVLLAIDNQPSTQS